jgi:hypothetical protein
MDKEVPPLKVGTGWIGLAVTGEATVIQTFRGYAPVLPVKVIATGLDYILYISAKSLAEKLEPLREGNGGQFGGLTFSIRKAADEQFSPYEIKPS